MAGKKQPAGPLYVRPPREPMTAEDWQALRERGPGDPLTELLDAESAALREFLAREGLPVLEQVDSKSRVLERRESVRSVDGGFVCYRKGTISAGAIEAIEALQAIEMVRRTSGDWRAMWAFSAGAAIERTRTTVAWARAIHAGAGTIQGGKKGAARAHGPPDERRAKHEAWRARYAELRLKFPEADKDDLLEMIAAEPGGKSARTLRRYIKAK